MSACRSEVLPLEMVQFTRIASHCWLPFAVIVQDSAPTPSYSLATTAIDPKSPLRASAPAAPTSALDKAMSFLDKYKQGNSSTAPRRSADVPSATFDEDELEISLSSDSDAPGRQAARKAPSRLKVSRNKIVLEPQRATAVTSEDDPASRSLTLTGMPSSARFATAKELGINLGPKSAVSPVGLKKNNSTKSNAGSAQSHVDAHSPFEDQKPGLRLAVNIPGESSAHASLRRQDSDSEVESLGSAVAEALEETICGEDDEIEDESRLGSLISEPVSDFEVDAGGNSRLVGPTLEQHSGSAIILKQDSREAGDTGFARVPPGRTTLGKIMSFDELATVSGQQICSASENREENGVDNGSDRFEGNGGNHARYSTAEPATEDEDNEDDYGDDDFEDQDVLMESNGENPREHHALGEPTSTVGGAATRCFEEVVSQQPILGHGSSPASTTTFVTANIENDKTPHPVTAPVGSRVTQPISPVGELVNYREHESLQRPREAWAVLEEKKYENQTLPVTSDSGTNPGSCMNPDNELKDDPAPENNRRADGRASSGAREAWGMRSASESLTKGAKGDKSNAAVTTGEEEDGVDQPHNIPNAGQCRHRESEAARGAGNGKESVGVVSKRGLLIDRSSEDRDPIRPPGSEVKVVVRAEAVASVEYAHDPESGLDLRSCGTQVRQRHGLPLAMKRNESLRCCCQAFLDTIKHALGNHCFV